MKIGLVTDIHYADKDPAIGRFYRESTGKLREAVDRFNAEKCDFVVELGDLIDSAPTAELELAALKSIRSELAAFGRRTHCVLGNHCVAGLSKAEFLAQFGAPPNRSFYSFDRGAFHFVVLDGCFRADGEPYCRGNFKWTDAEIPPDQRDWLRKDLAGTAKGCLVFVHQRLDVETPHAVKSAPAVREILENSGRVRAVFQGHSHKNDYIRIRGIHYCTLRAMVEGSGADNSGYAVLNLFADGSMHLAGFRQQEDRQLE